MQARTLPARGRESLKERNCLPICFTRTCFNGKDRKVRFGGWCPDSEVRKHWRHTLMRTSESKGHYQVYDSSAPFEPEVRNRTPRHGCANFGFGALALLFALHALTSAPILSSRPRARMARQFIYHMQG